MSSDFPSNGNFFAEHISLTAMWEKLQYMSTLNAWWRD